MLSQSGLRWLKHPGWLLVAGGLMPLTLAPLYWWPIALICFGLLFYSLNSLLSAQQKTGKTLFLRTWLFSFGQFLVGVSWVYVSIQVHGNTPVWLACLMVLAFTGFLALIPATILTFVIRFTGLTPLTFASTWFAAEWVRGVIFTGFPWLFVGDAHIDTPLSGWAPVIGSFGIGFLMVWLSALLVQWIIQPERRSAMPAVAVLVLCGLGLPLNKIEWTSSPGEVTVAAVQGNISQEEKWIPSNILPTLDVYHSQTKSLLGQDLVLWPETAITMLEHDYRRFRVDIEELATNFKSTIITGIPYQHPPSSELSGRFHNSIIAFGNGEGIYHKQQLVPFGEYVPFAQLIQGLIPFFDIPVHGFLSGESNQSPLQVSLSPKPNLRLKSDMALVHPYICYEIAYPSLVNRTAAAADLLVTISNDAWFGDSLGPKQHLGLAQMRALETQRFVLRATNTGFTALINERGKLIDTLPTNQYLALTGSAERRTGVTPYMFWQHYPLLLIFFLGLLWFGIVKKGRGE